MNRTRLKIFRNESVLLIFVKDFHKIFLCVVLVDCVSVNSVDGSVVVLFVFACVV